MKKISRYALAALSILTLGSSCSEQPSTPTGQTIPESITISTETLMDKIKGGWAGQTIGCSYGGPTEFKYNGTMIQDYVPIAWPDGYIKWWYENVPGLYDDVYMDLTFVDVRSSRTRRASRLVCHGVRQSQISFMACQSSR